MGIDLGGDISDPNGVLLGVGVRGEVGALSWDTNSGVHLVPVGGTNEDDVMYRLGGLHESYMPVGSEVPVETVYEVLSEFLVTRRLPECVEWRPAA